MEHMYKSRVAAHEKKAPAAPWPLLAAFGHAELSNSREIRAKRLQKKENRPRFFQRRQNVANFHRRGAGVAARDGLDLGVRKAAFLGSHRSPDRCEREKHRSGDRCRRCHPSDSPSGGPQRTWLHPGEPGASATGAWENPGVCVPDQPVELFDGLTPIPDG